MSGLGNPILGGVRTTGNLQGQQPTRRNSLFGANVRFDGELLCDFMLGFARRRAIAAMPYVAKQPNRRQVVVVGSGWAGATLSTALDERKYKVTVVSPEETTPYTPLLASAACGLYDFRYGTTSSPRSPPPLKQHESLLTKPAASWRPRFVTRQWTCDTSKHVLKTWTSHPRDANVLLPLMNCPTHRQSISNCLTTTLFWHRAAQTIPLARLE